jgi:hypothetical protein
MSETFSTDVLYHTTFNLILKMEAKCSSETPIDFHRTKRRYIPEDRAVHNYCCENLRS